MFCADVVIAKNNIIRNDNILTVCDLLFFIILFFLFILVFPPKIKDCHYSNKANELAENLTCAYGQISGHKAYGDIRNHYYAYDIQYWLNSHINISLRIQQKAIVLVLQIVVHSILLGLTRKLQVCLTFPKDFGVG